MDEKSELSKAIQYQKYMLSGIKKTSMTTISQENLSVISGHLKNKKGGIRREEDSGDYHQIRKETFFKWNLVLCISPLHGNVTWSKVRLIKLANEKLYRHSLYCDISSD